MQANSIRTVAGDRPGRRSDEKTLTGIIADAVHQLTKPNGAQYVFNGFTAIISDYASGKWPLLSPAINEVTNKVNDSGTATSLQDRVKDVIKK